MNLQRAANLALCLQPNKKKCDCPMAGLKLAVFAGAILKGDKEELS